jgi:hypothetical protein
MKNGRLDSPWSRWSRDPRQLAHLTADALRQAFVLYLKRTVTNDRLVPIDGVDYEIPRDLGPSARAGAAVQITHRLLAGTYHVVGGDGQLVRIWPVDLTANARSPRARRARADQDDCAPLTRTAADMAFEHDLGPVIDDDGNALPPATAGGVDGA